MRLRARNVVVVLAVNVLMLAGSGADGFLKADVAAAVAQPSVRIAEFHYDNTGTDAGEAIEISGPAGADITGWTVVLYNGNDGAVYNTGTLSGQIPVTCVHAAVVLTTQQRHSKRQSDGLALSSDKPGRVPLTMEGSSRHRDWYAALTSTERKRDRVDGSSRSSGTGI